MTDIIVTRGAGASQGADIVDPLLATTAVALERGRALLEKTATDLRSVSMTTLFRSGVKTGQVVEVHDEDQGVAWRGKIKTISHRAGSGTLVSRLTLERAA